MFEIVEECFPNPFNEPLVNLRGAFELPEVDSDDAADEVVIIPVRRVMISCIMQTNLLSKQLINCGIENF